MRFGDIVSSELFPTARLKLEPASLPVNVPDAHVIDFRITAFICGGNRPFGMIWKGMVKLIEQMC